MVAPGQRRITRRQPPCGELAEAAQSARSAGPFEKGDRSNGFRRTMNGVNGYRLESLVVRHAKLGARLAGGGPLAASGHNGALLCVCFG